MRRTPNRSVIAGQAVFVILMFVAVLTPLIKQSAKDPDEEVTLQRFRAVSMATLGYTFDWDDCMPLSMSYSNASAQWRVTSFTAIPQGWTSTGGRNVQPRLNEESLEVHNTINPYLRTYRPYEAKGMANHGIGFVAAPKRAMQVPALNGITYNGLLQAWYWSAVAEPGKLPLFVQNYRENTVGASVALPVLNCLTTGPVCRFNSSACPQNGGTCGSEGAVWFRQTAPENFSVWAYQHRMVVVTVDGSVVSKQFESPLWPAYVQNVNDNPWSSFDPQGPPGSPYWLTYCVQPHHDKGNGGSVRYPGYFRPDNEYTYTNLECDFGGG